MDANGIKTQLFQKICPKFLNRSVVTAPSTDDCPVLPAGSRGIRYASPYFLSVIAAGGRPSTWSPPGRPRGSRKKYTLNQLWITQKLSQNHFKLISRPEKNSFFFQKIIIFLTPRGRNLRPLLPLATGYRGANPCACASAISIKIKKNLKSWCYRNKNSTFSKNLPEICE